MNHAQASQIQVQVDMGSDQVTAVVEDNGSGFNVEDALGSGNKTIGLATLRERTEMLGGALNIQSNLGQGTRVEFLIPITEEERFGGSSY
jgi:two-component system sensor histidine kinase DegS